MLYENLYAVDKRADFAKAQMSKSRSSAICVVVERPDHHSGDDRLIITRASQTRVSSARLIHVLKLYAIKIIVKVHQLVDQRRSI